MPEVKRRKLVCVDSETNGKDFFHGARPFFVSTCNEDGEQRWWEWDIDPITRHVFVPRSDLAAVRELVASNDLVGQNIKFDAAALTSMGVGSWPWGRTHDTLMAGHVLASNEPHDLTSMVLHYLGRDIKPLEEALKKAVKEGRDHCRRRLPEWRIAKDELDEMPSASGETWGYDYWLPRVLRKLEKHGPPEWDTVLEEYANADSVYTIALWKVMEAELHRLDLWEIYLERVKVLPTLSEMEDRGAGLLLGNLEGLQQEYLEEKAASEEACLGIANGRSYDLELPKGSANNFSLKTFCFGWDGWVCPTCKKRHAKSDDGGKVPWTNRGPRCPKCSKRKRPVPDLMVKTKIEGLSLPRIKWTETGEPSLDKEVIEEYKKILDGDQLAFVKALSAGRKRGKSLEFMESYVKHGLRRGKGLALLHSSVNPTGTSTTRFSSAAPNMQQVSKQSTECEECLGEGCEACGGTGEDLHSVRRCFGPLPGREWWSADAQNIELRIPAYESGEPDLVALFERPDEPPFYGSQHLLNFSVVYDDLWQEELDAVGFDKVGPHCKKKYSSGPYQFVKNGDFALQYQCGRDTADRSFRRQGSFDKLKSKFTKLDELNRRWVAFAEKHGYVETLPDKTVNPRRGYPLLCARGEWGRVVSTTPLNYHTQGTAGWWMLKAMIRCQDRFLEWRKDGWDGRIVLTVHDELVFDLPKGIGPKPWLTNLPRMRAVKRLMEQGGEDMGIPTPVGIEFHAEHWGKGMTVKM